MERRTFLRGLAAGTAWMVLAASSNTDGSGLCAPEIPLTQRQQEVQNIIEGIPGLPDVRAELNTYFNAIGADVSWTNDPPSDVEQFMNRINTSPVLSPYIQMVSTASQVGIYVNVSPTNTSMSGSCAFRFGQIDTVTDIDITLPQMGTNNGNNMVDFWGSMTPLSTVILAKEGADAHIKTQMIKAYQENTQFAQASVTQREFIEGMYRKWGNTSNLDAALVFVDSAEVIAFVRSIQAVGGIDALKNVALGNSTDLPANVKESLSKSDFFTKVGNLVGIYSQLRNGYSTDADLGFSNEWHHAVKDNGFNGIFAKIAC